jgi:hypothetical protein
MAFLHRTHKPPFDSSNPAAPFAGDAGSSSRRVDSSRPIWTAISISPIPYGEKNTCRRQGDEHSRDVVPRERRFRQRLPQSRGRWPRVPQIRRPAKLPRRQRRVPVQWQFRPCRSAGPACAARQGVRFRLRGVAGRGLRSLNHTASLRSRERSVAVQTTSLVRRFRIQGCGTVDIGGRRSLLSAGFYFIPLFLMERNFESSDRRIARMRSMIDDNQLVPVIPRWVTDRMLERWYKDRVATKSRVPGRWFDRTVVTVAVLLGIVNLLPW